jgi:hypothetical protein
MGTVYPSSLRDAWRLAKDWAGLSSTFHQFSWPRREEKVDAAKGVVCNICPRKGQIARDCPDRIDKATVNVVHCV